MTNPDHPSNDQASADPRAEQRTVGARLREGRETLGLTQEDVAAHWAYRGPALSRSKRVGAT